MSNRLKKIFSMWQYESLRFHVRNGWIYVGTMKSSLATKKVRPYQTIKSLRPKSPPHICVRVSTCYDHNKGAPVWLHLEIRGRTRHDECGKKDSRTEVGHPNLVAARIRKNFPDSCVLGSRCGWWWMEREREGSHCIWTYLSSIQYKHLKIVCNSKVTF